jgi:hypothetical protein
MSSFELSRSTHIDAPSDQVRPLLEDFREWQKWSPWEGLDPNLNRTFTGPEKGVGSHYHWSGNKQAGEGTMEITKAETQLVEVDLRFLKPFKATNVTSFHLTPAGGGTDVTWVMTGERSAIMSLMGKLYFDKSIGKDFEKGLASLKEAAESPR